jgi:hypothetical protein
VCGAIRFFSETRTKTASIGGANNEQIRHERSRETRRLLLVYRANIGGSVEAGAIGGLGASTASDTALGLISDPTVNLKIQEELDARIEGYRRVWRLDELEQKSA